MLNIGFLWETWRRSPAEPSYCMPEYRYNEINVKRIKLNDGTTWKYTNDHSKIGCSEVNSSNKYVCVGGINRMYSQRKRGGGTLCFIHENLWHAFYSAFYETDSC